MSEDLQLIWNESIQVEQLKLHFYDSYNIGSSLSPEISQNTATFKPQKSCPYLLEWQYQFHGICFNSYFFLLDYPDISYIKVNILEPGAQFDELGFFDEHNKFIDMLIYEGTKPWLTYSLDAQYMNLAQWFLNDKGVDIQQKKQTLDELVSDLSQAFPVLCKMWGYQLKYLIDPVLLAKTTAEWKACLIQVVRNHLILMDNERLYMILQDAIKYAQEHQRVNELVALMDWDSDKQDWVNEAQFLQELKGKRMLK